MGSVALVGVDFGVTKCMSGFHFCTRAWENGMMLVGISDIQMRLHKCKTCMLYEVLLPWFDISIVPFRTRDVVHLCRSRWII